MRGKSRKLAKLNMFISSGWRTQIRHQRRRLYAVIPVCVVSRIGPLADESDNVIASSTENENVGNNKGQ